MKIYLVIFIVILVILMLIQSTKELREEFSDYKQMVSNLIEGEPESKNPHKKRVLLLKGELPLTVNKEIVYNTVDTSSAKYIKMPVPIASNNVEEFSYSFWFIKRRNGNIENKTILLRGNKESDDKAPYIRFTNNGITNKQTITVEINTTAGLKTIILSENAFSEGVQLNQWYLYTFNFRPYMNNEGTAVVGSLFEFYVNASLKHVELYDDNVKFLTNRGALYVYPQMGFNTREDDFIGSIGNMCYYNHAQNIVDIEQEMMNGYKGLVRPDNSDTTNMGQEADILLNDKRRSMIHLREVSV